MLVRRGMEHDLGPVVLEDLLDPGGVAEVRKAENDRVPDPGGRIVEMSLVMVEQHQLGGLTSGDLPCDLGTDRTAPPGDQHSATCEHRLHRLCVDLDLLSADQVLDSQIADVSQRDTIAHEIAESGQELQRHVDLFRGCRDARDQAVARARYGQDHAMRVQCLNRFRDVGGRARDRYAEQGEALLARVVVEYRDWNEPTCTAALHLSHDRRTCFARADDHDAQPARVTVAAAMEREQPRLESERSDEDRRNEAAEHRDRERDRVVGCDVHHEDAHHGRAAGFDNALGFLDAGVPPHLTVETEGPVRHEVNRKGCHDELEERCAPCLRNIAVEAEDQHADIRADDQHQVEREQ